MICNQKILLDTSILKIMYNSRCSDDLADRLKIELNTYLSRQKKWDLVVPPMLALEFLGMKLKVIPAPKFPDFNASLTSEQRTSSAFDVAYEHYSRLEDLSASNIQRLILDNKKFRNCDSSLRVIFSLLEEHLSSNKFVEKARIALVIDSLMALRKWGDPPKDWSPPIGKINSYSRSRQFQIEMEIRLIAEGFRLKSEGFPSSISRRIGSLYELMLKDYEVNINGTWRPLKSVVNLGSRDNGGDCEYLDISLLGEDGDPVVIYTLDNYNEVYSRIAVLRHLYIQYLKQLNDSKIITINIPNLICGKIIVLNSNLRSEIDVTCFPNLKDVFRLSLTDHS